MSVKRYGGLWIEDIERSGAIRKCISEFVLASDFAALEAERDALHAALTALVTSLADHDEEGLIEHAEPMRAARLALALKVQP